MHALVFLLILIFVLLPIAIVIGIIIIIVKALTGGFKKPTPPLPAQPTLSPDAQAEINRLNTEMNTELEKDEPDGKKLKQLYEQLKSTKQPSFAQIAHSSNIPVAHTTYFDEHQQQVVAQKVATDNSGMNILLYAGSFLVVSASALFVGTIGDSTARMTALILATLAFYVIGALVVNNHRLASAGRALIITALAVIPFWGFAFVGFLNLAPDLAWFITSLVGLFASFATAIWVKSVGVSFLTIAFLISLVCSIAFLLRLPPLGYFLLLTILSFLATLLHLFCAKFLSVFTQSIQILSHLSILIMIFVGSALLSPIPSVLYSVVFMIATAQYTVRYLANRSYTNEVFLRFLIHTTLLATVADFFHFHNSSAFIFGSAWWILAAIHAAISIIRPRSNSDKSPNNHPETIITALNLFAIFITPIFLVSLSRPTLSVIYLVALAVAAILATVAHHRHQQFSWHFITLASLIIAPFVIHWGFLSGISTSIYYVAIFSSYIAILTLISPYLLNQSNAEKSNFAKASLAIIATLLVVTALGASNSLILAFSFFILAAAIARYGHLTKNTNSLEFSIYVATLSLFSLLHYAGVDSIASVYIAVAVLLGTSLWRDNHRTNLSGGTPRAVFAVIIFTAIPALRALNPSIPEIWSMIFLAQQSALLVLGALVRRQWIIFTGLFSIIASVFFLFSHLSFVGVILVGMTIIGIVIWRTYFPKK